MLPTELQPLDRFKAVRPVLKPSSRFQSHPCQRTYTCTHIYCSACRAWSTHVCCVCNVYDTASCREACGVVVYRECLFFLCIGAVQEQEIISVYCLCHQLLQSKRVVSAENITIAMQCVSWKWKSQSLIFAVKIARRKNRVLACGYRSTSYLSSHLLSLSHLLISS